jgi:hypothetical protein
MLLNEPHIPCEVEERQMAHTTKVLFDDGDYFVALTDRNGVRIGLKNVRSFDVPYGHAYYDRIAETTSTDEAEGYFDEMVAAHGVAA